MGESANALTTNNNSETENILNAAAEDAAFEKIMKFNKGEYLISKEEVPAGTEYVAHAKAWTKEWVRFDDDEVTDRKRYRVADGEKPCDRSELSDPELEGSDDDPWSLQYLLPLENPTSGEVVIFTTGSIGGRRAVSDLCKAYAQRMLRGQHGQPIIKLASGEMKTKNYGNVACPKFEIAGWDDEATTEAAVIPMQPMLQKKKPAASRDMDDEIPF